MGRVERENKVTVVVRGKRIRTIKRGACTFKWEGKIKLVAK